jgi:hypothetical protein
MVLDGAGGTSETADEPPEWLIALGTSDDQAYVVVAREGSVRSAPLPNVPTGELTIDSLPVTQLDAALDGLRTSVVEAP